MAGQNISSPMQLQMPPHMMARQSCEGNSKGNQDEQRMAHVVFRSTNLFVKKNKTH